jgi:hypothetical protein
MDTLPRGSTPVPDPTILTTQQLVREIAASREIIEANIGKIETRLDAMDTATELNKQATDKIPRIIDEKVCQLRKLFDERFTTVNERFRSIDTQFAERDTRTESVAQLGQKALEAALSAAKEAVGEQNKSNALANAKMEAAFTKQIDGITLLIQNAIKALDEKINDLKGRLDRGEGVKAQAVENKGQQNWMIGAVIGGMSLVISLGVLIVLVLK